MRFALIWLQYLSKIQFQIYLSFRFFPFSYVTLILLSLFRFKFGLSAYFKHLKCLIFVLFNKYLYLEFRVQLLAVEQGFKDLQLTQKKSILFDTNQHHARDFGKCHSLRQSSKLPEKSDESTSEPNYMNSELVCFLFFSKQKTFGNNLA